MWSILGAELVAPKGGGGEEDDDGEEGGGGGEVEGVC